ncbi:SDR family oxidoreductase [Helicobacter cappadocius]|uniref:SDR family oxidoreductase n=1 Tax=Helicobacter cappadocius TaxID=3063998 RepID=A0AA90PRY2_9HELI|nr:MULTISPECIES: SDR family oxidoreductase [unclassified Helicobacter]MDO7253004.1 SDR family oxidoreductase [Helicobacter sp. faydin-H75]MDP2539007.1 SDR family oxidoreductase [Helicobacter sp. faydin-H76]
MIIFITGASAGFGEAISKRFIKEGHKVIALARREEKLQKLQNELGENYQFIACDVNNVEKIKNDLKNLPEGFRNIDVLINNAGLALGLESADKANIEDWEMMINTNITALIKLTHLLLPKMVERKKGHIINIGSIAGSYPYPGGNVYGGTKAFVKQFSLNLRADLYDKNIRVTNIEPGLCGGSEFSIVRFRGDKTKAKQVYENTTPLLPEDVAEAVFWCTSLPNHVNINRIELMPTTQAPAALNVAKSK